MKKNSKKFFKAFFLLATVAFLYSVFSIKHKKPVKTVQALSSECYDQSGDSPGNPKKGGRKTDTGIQIFFDEDTAADVEPTDSDREKPKTPTIRWKKNHELPSGITGNDQCRYWIQISKESNDDNIVYDTNKVISEKNSHQIGEDYLPRGETYYLRGANRDEYGWTPWTDWLQFYLPKVPADKPNDLSVSQPNESNCGVEDAKIKFDWDFIANESGDSQRAYRIQVSENSNVVFDTGKTKSNNSELTTSFTNNFSYDQTYEWRVKTWDSEDYESDWTSNKNFEIERPYIDNLTIDEPEPEDYCSKDQPPAFYLSWDFNSPDNHPQSYYQLQAATDPSFNNIISDYDTGITSCPSGGCVDYEFTMDDTDFKTEYHWRIRGWDSKCNEAK